MAAKKTISLQEKQVCCLQIVLTLFTLFAWLNLISVFGANAVLVADWPIILKLPCQDQVLLSS